MGHHKRIFWGPMLHYELRQHEDVNTVPEAIFREKDYADAVGMPVYLVTKFGVMEIQPNALEIDLADTWARLCECAQEQN